MGCETRQVMLDDGTTGTAIVCSRGQRRQQCSVGFCGKDSVALCDYPVVRNGKSTTCDSPMCERHRHPVAGEADKDWCEGHFNYEQRQAAKRGGYAGAEQE